MAELCNDCGKPDAILIVEDIYCEEGHFDQLFLCRRCADRRDGIQRDEEDDVRRDYCDRCSVLVPTHDLKVVETCRQSHSSPAEFASWCGACRGEDRDVAYERAASRAVSDDFQATRGKDWR